MNWYIISLWKYAEFSGRARRKEYWIFYLYSAIALLILTFIDIQFDSDRLLSKIFTLALLIPFYAVGWRRMHDTDHSGWWLLIPLYNIILLAREGQREDNRFGSDPKVETTRQPKTTRQPPIPIPPLRPVPSEEPAIPITPLDRQWPQYNTWLHGETKPFFTGIAIWFIVYALETIGIFSNLNANLNSIPYGLLIIGFIFPLVGLFFLLLGSLFANRVSRFMVSFTTVKSWMIVNASTVGLQLLVSVILNITGFHFYNKLSSDMRANVSSLYWGAIIYLLATTLAGLLIFGRIVWRVEIKQVIRAVSILFVLYCVALIALIINAQQQMSQLFRQIGF